MLRKAGKIRCTLVSRACRKIPRKGVKYVLSVFIVNFEHICQLYFNVNVLFVDFEQVKEGVGQLFSYRICDVIWKLISWFLSSANFSESLIPHCHSKSKWWRSQVVIILSEKKKLDAALPEFVLVFISIFNKVARSTKLRGTPFSWTCFEEHVVHQKT